MDAPVKPLSCLIVLDRLHCTAVDFEGLSVVESVLS